MLAQTLEIGHRLVARQHALDHGLVLCGQFGHALFDGGQVLRRERALVGEVVVKAILDDRPDGDLRLRKQLLHRIGQQVSRGMADQLQTIGVLVGDDRQTRVGIDDVAQVDEPGAIAFTDPAGQRGFGQSGTDRCGGRRPR